MKKLLRLMSYILVAALASAATFCTVHFMPNDEYSKLSELKALVEDMFLDDTVDFLEEMPANVVKKVLANADEHTRALINQFLNYPENSAGTLMTIEYVDLRDYFTVRKAMDYIRRTGIDKETVYTCYVIDEQRRLVGQVSLRKLIIAPESTYIRVIMDTNIVSATTTDDQEIVADDFRRYDLTSIAVCDREARLVGIITIDDVVAAAKTLKLHTVFFLKGEAK